METEWSVVWEVESRRLGYLKIPQALHLQHLVQMSFRQVEHHLLHIQLNELLFAGLEVILFPYQDSDVGHHELQ